MEQKIQKIMCCCGNGVGTSLLMQMTVEEALETLGISGIEVLFGALADIFTGKRQILFVVSEELEADYRDMPVIGLEDLTDSDLAAEKLKQVLEMR